MATLKIFALPVTKIAASEIHKSKVVRLYYIFSGCCKSFIFDPTGKEKVIMFAFTDWWITDIDSFTNGTISPIKIQASAEAVVYELTKSDFDDLITTYTSFESAVRKMMQYSYIRKQRRSMDSYLV